MICRAVWPLTTLKSSKKLNLFKNLRWLVGIFGGPGIPADLSSLACRGAPRVPGQVSPDALDTRLDRFVGLKALPAEKVADTDLKRRFVQEPRPYQPCIIRTSSAFVMPAVLKARTRLPGSTGHSRQPRSRSTTRNPRSLSYRGTGLTYRFPFAPRLRWALGG